MIKLVTDPEWVVAKRDVLNVEKALAQWKAAATALGGECQHISRLTGSVTIRETTLDELNTIVEQSSKDLDALATKIRMSDRVWESALGVNKLIVLAYGGGRTEAVLEISQYIQTEWGSDLLGGPARIIRRSTSLYPAVHVQLRDGLVPDAYNPDAWWSSLRKSYETRKAAANL